MGASLTLPVLAEMSGSGSADARAGIGEAARVRREDFEAFSALPAAIGERLGREPRVVLITGEDDGKCAAGICLAAAAAAAGRRTALLECDFAAPALSVSLGLEPAPGLSEYLRREARAGEILQTVDLAGPAVPNGVGSAVRLVVVVAGGQLAGANEPLAAEDFGHAIAKLRSAYDLVVLDGPPVGQALALAGAAAHADATLACVKRSRASGRSARSLEAALSGLPTPVAGLVLVDG